MDKDLILLFGLLGMIVLASAMTGLAALIFHLRYKIHQNKVRKVCEKYPAIVEMLRAMHDKENEYAELHREMREIERKIDKVCDEEIYMTRGATKDVLEPLREKWMEKNMLKIFLRNDIDDRRAAIEKEMEKYSEEVQLCWSWEHMED